MTDLPPRLLDAEPGRLAERLLRSAAVDAPPAGSLAKALATAATASTTVASAGVAATGLSKAIATWLLVGSVGGGVVSVAASAVSSRLDERSAPVAVHRESSARVAPSERAQSGAGVQPEPAPNPDAPPAPPADALLEPMARPETRRPSSAPSAARQPSAASIDRSREPRAAVGPDVAEELVLIDAARRGLAGGDPGATLALLSAYRRSFPAGHFRPEALALEIEAHVRRGEKGAAERLAARFFESYPAHPLAARVRAQLRNR